MDTMSLLGKLFLLNLLICALGEDFHMTILHTNDVHARIEETNKYGGPCESDCFGGVARRHTVIQEIRRSHENVLLLDAGDQFQGTLWFNYYQGNATKHFIKKLGYDVITLGNHEFDNGIEGLAAYLKDLMIPVVCANLNTSKTPSLQNLVTASTVINVGGRQVGVIGYVTELTPQLVKPDGIVGLNFTDTIKSVQREVDRLKARGVNIIIGLGHVGYQTDIEIAKAVTGLDVIVGGHTNTFLYNGEPPSNDVPVGPYPTLIGNKDKTTLAVTQTEFQGDMVPIVQAFTNGKYLGYLNLTFDEDGILRSWAGNPILLDSDYEQDRTILDEVNTWQIPLELYRQVPVGQSLVYMEGYTDYCRLQECNMGNMVTDAMVDFYLKKLPGTKGWANVSLAVWNSGGFVNSIQKGEITLGDVAAALPYRNTIERIDVNGSTLVKILEHSASKYDLQDPSGRYLQYSGFKVTYTETEGDIRVVSVDVRCAACDVPSYASLDPVATYSVLINDFLVQGGDGYDMIAKEMVGRMSFGDLVTDMVEEYIKKNSPLRNGVEGRIQMMERSMQMITPSGQPRVYECVSSAPAALPSSAFAMIILAVSLTLS